MEFQVLFNIALGALSFLIGFLVNNIWQEIKSLQETDKKTVERISAIEVLVAGNYITRQDFNHTMDKVFAKLDEIGAGLNRKADR